MKKYSLLFACLLFLACSDSKKEINESQMDTTTIIADTLFVDTVSASPACVRTPDTTDYDMLKHLIKNTENSKDKITEIRKIKTENKELKKELVETKKELETIKSDMAKDTIKKKKGLIKRIVESIKKDTI